MDPRYFGLGKTLFNKASVSPLERNRSRRTIGYLDTSGDVNTIRVRRSLVISTESLGKKRLQRIGANRLFEPQHRSIKHEMHVMTQE